MNWQGADRVALALARLAARLAGLGPLVSLVDDIRRPPTVSAGREPALDDVVRTVSRALQDIPELRRNVSSSQMESAVLALVERLDRIPKGADPLLCYRPASLQAVLSQADTLVQRRLGDEAAFSFYCRLRNEASLAIAHSLVSAPNAAALIARELYVRQDDPVVSEWRSQLQIEQHRQYHRWMLASHSYLMRVLDSLNYFDSPGVDLGESDWRRELSDVFVCPTIGGHSRNVSLREVEELLGRGSATLVESSFA